MNFTMNIPGLKDVTIQKVEETGERIALHVSLPMKAQAVQTVQTVQTVIN